MGFSFVNPLHTLIEDAYPLVNTYQLDRHGELSLYSDDYSLVDLSLTVEVTVKSIIKGIEVES